MSTLKAVILAGGFGTRISEISTSIPKPLIEIGEMPLLLHIMNIYSSYGVNDFVICLGYKAKMITEYFLNYFSDASDSILNLKNDVVHISKNNIQPWNILLVDTGLHTMTGGRLKQVQEYLDDETFCLTYGDDLKKVNISELIQFHKSQHTVGTMTVFQPKSQFGVVNIVDNKILNIREKPVENKWVNGGYYVLEPKIFDYLNDSSTVFEHTPLEKLSKEQQLSAYKYTGEYNPMDSLSDKNRLDSIWNSGDAYWKTW